MFHNRTPVVEWEREVGRGQRTEERGEEGIVVSNSNAVLVIMTGSTWRCRRLGLLLVERQTEVAQLLYCLTRSE
jgi:hypothetical protein